MALILPLPLRQRLHDHACEGYPHEVVGVLAGRRTTGEVTHIVPLTNERTDRPGDRYVVSGLTLFRAEEALVADGLDVLGYYHSHPDHPAVYSEYDRDHALPNLSYVITSVQRGAIADTRSWRLRDDRSAMDEEPLTLPE